MSCSEEVRVLIVEDEKPMRERLTSLLEAPPLELQAVHFLPRFRVFPAESKESAAGALKRARATGQPFDLVILDLGLPERDGGYPRNPAIGLNLLADFRAAQIPVVVYSQYGNPDALTRAINEQATGFVAKPSDRLAPDAYAPLVQVVAQVWQRSAERAWADCRGQRLREWVLAQSFAVLCNRMRTAVARGLTVVAGCATVLDELSRVAGPTGLADRVTKCARDLRAAVREIGASADQARSAAVGRADYAAVEEDSVVDVAEAIRATVRELRSGILSRRLTLDTPAIAGLSLWAPPRTVRLLVESLIFQAIDQAPCGGRVSLDVRPTTAGCCVRIVPAIPLAPAARAALLGASDPPDFRDEWTWAYVLVRNLVEFLAGSVMVGNVDGREVIDIEIVGGTNGPSPAD